MTFKKAMILLSILLLFILICALAPRPGQPNDNVAEEYITLNSIEYEKARFEKFNSPASKNGLGGTNIYIDGVAATVDETSQIVYAHVKDDKAKEWIVLICTEAFGKKEDYVNYIEQPLSVYGYYTGYSDKKNMPVIVADEIHLKKTGNILQGLGVIPENRRVILQNTKIKLDDFFDRLSVKFNSSFGNGHIIEDKKVSIDKEKIIVNIFTVDFFDFIEGDEVSLIFDVNEDDNNVRCVRFLAPPDINELLSAMVSLVIQEIDDTLSTTDICKKIGLVPLLEQNSFFRFPKFNITKTGATATHLVVNIYIK